LAHLTRIRPTRSGCWKNSLAIKSASLRTPKSFKRFFHRCAAIGRRDAIQPAFDALLGIVDQALAIDRATAERAKAIVMGNREMSARDAVHLAVMEENRIQRI
jgi:predicted nucleic acid-binding protein